MRIASSSHGHKRPPSPGGAHHDAKRVRGGARPTEALGFQIWPHLPDEVWLGILTHATLTPPELARLQHVDRRLGRLSCDDTLWRGFVPEHMEPPLQGAYAAFVAGHAQLSRRDRRAVGQLWQGRGPTDILGAHSAHFGVAQACAHRQGRRLREMSEGMRNDACIVDTAIASAPAAFEFASKRLQKTPERLMQAVAAEPALWRFVPNHLLQTEAFACSWALRLLQRHAFAPALGDFLDVLDDFKAHPVAHAHVVACHFELGALAQARQAFALAQRLVPNFAEQHPELAFICTPEPADAALHEAVCALWPRLRDTQLQAALGRADAMWQALLRYEDVQGFCVGPYRLTTRLGHVFGILADRRAQSGDNTQAAALYLRALTYSPDNRQLRLAYAFMLLEAGRFNAARAELRPLAMGTPDILGAWTGLALCDAANGELTRAKATITRGTRRTLGAGTQASIVSMGLMAGLVGTTREVLHLIPLRLMLARMPCRHRIYRTLATAMQDESFGYEYAAVFAAADVWAALQYDAGI